jgi:HEAT repeat protein
MKHIALVVVLLVSGTAAAEDVAYRTGGREFAAAWHRFYDLGDHEPELDDPLIRRGRKMVPAICEAVAHPDMKYRRYALSALGYIRDRRAIPCLERILKDRTEIDYFRGDALHAIYLIDQPLGRRYAEQFRPDNDYLARVHASIGKNAYPLDSSGLEEE